MMKNFGLVLLCLCSTFWASEPSWQSASGDQITQIGRTQLQGSQWQMTWPGTTLRGAFIGDSLRVTWEDGKNAFRIVIDGQDLGRMESQSGVRSQVWSGLGPGKHQLEWIKATESSASTAKVIAFEVPKSGRWLNPPGLKTRQIEFIGDSWTASLGNLSTVRECDWGQSQKLSDVTKGFGFLTAKALDADVRILAVSGQGMNRNWNGNDPHINMRLLYPKLLQNSSQIAEDSIWKPNVYVIGLGTNDFSTEIGPKESWTEATLAKAYLDSAGGFASQLRHKNPTAWIVFTGHFLWPKDQLQPLVAELVRKMQTQGDSKIKALFHNDLQLNGCLWHPDSVDHKQMSKRLVDSLTAWRVFP